MKKVVYFSVGSGGSDVALLSLLEEIRTKIELLVIVNDWGINNGLTQKLKERGISYYHINYGFSMWPKPSHYKTVFHFLYNLYRSIIINKISEIKLRKVIRSFDADIIHSNSSFIQIGYNLAKQLKIPHIWHIREFQDLHFNLIPIPTKKNFLNKLKSENNYNITITKCVYNHLNLPENSSVIYDGVYCKNYQYPETQKEKYFLFVGQLTANKGIFDLINAFIDFTQNNNDYKLYLAGHYIDTIKEQIEKILCEVKYLVEFLGERDDINILMSKASALIVPSKFEAFGLITAEAMFNKCLVIGNNTGGTKEQLDNGYNIFKDEIGIRYSNHAELVDAMNNVANFGCNHYMKMVDRAYATVKQLYTKEANANAIISIYQKVIL